jgi:hypothetical protein
VRSWFEVAQDGRWSVAAVNFETKNRKKQKQKRILSRQNKKITKITNDTKKTTKNKEQNYKLKKQNKPFASNKSTKRYKY